MNESAGVLPLRMPAFIRYGVVSDPSGGGVGLLMLSLRSSLLMPPSRFLVNGYGHLGVDNGVDSTW